MTRLQTIPTVVSLGVLMLIYPIVQTIGVLIVGSHKLDEVGSTHEDRMQELDRSARRAEVGGAASVTSTAADSDDTVTVRQNLAIVEPEVPVQDDL